MFPRSIIENELKQAIFQDETILNLTAWNGTMETSDKDLDSKPNGIS
jgi:hypothetical protein